MADKSDDKKKLPPFVFVKTTSPRGQFGRAGLRFTRDWRPLKIDAKADLEAGVIDAEIYARLEAEKEMLAVRPATADEIRELTATPELTATAPKDKDEVIAALQKKNAELEGRLMKLELAVGGRGGNTGGQQTGGNAPKQS
jgi:hypothetical protein